jgi:hypothetical protein
MAADLHGTVLGRVWQIFGSGRCRSFRVNEDLSRHDLPMRSGSVCCRCCPLIRVRGTGLGTHGVTLLGEYGNWKTVYGRHRRWSLDATWEKILDRLRARLQWARGRGLDGERGFDGRLRPPARGRSPPRPGRRRGNRGTAE